MKLYIFQTLLFFVAFATFSFGNPIEMTKEVESTTSNKHVKRYDVNTYLSSIGHFFLSDDIEHANYDGSNGSTAIDIYYSKKEKDTKNPVVVYFYGGSWYLGEKSLYSKLGNNLRNRGFITVIPNYAQFPFGNLDNMVYDITEAIKWVYYHIEKYGGDRDNIIVLGHSSGAHLLALTILRNNLGLGSFTGNDKYYAHGLPPLKRAVLLNGPYDFDLLSERAKKEGKKIKNTKTRKVLETALSSRDASPTEILKRYKDKSIYTFRIESIVLMHAEEDATVPVTSSYEFLREIERTSQNPAGVYLTHGYYHCGITEGVMNEDEGAIEYLIKGLMSDLGDLTKESESKKGEQMAMMDPEKVEEKEKENKNKDNESQSSFDDTYEWDGEKYVMKDKSQKNDYWFENQDKNYRENEFPFMNEEEEKPWWQFW